MNIYTIDWGVFADNWLLTALRKPFNRAFAKCLLRPVVVLHNTFAAFRQDSLYKVQHNSQIVYMEAMLNDAFDPSQRRIRIANTVFKTPVYFYEPMENREVYFSEAVPVYFNEQKAFVGEGVDFSVCVPPSLRPNNNNTETALLTRMRGQIDYYNLYSKNYNILWVQINS